MRYPPEVMKGLTPLLVLQALADVELGGIDIVRRVRERGDDGIEIAEGTIYPLLYRLEREKLVAARWLAGDGRRRQRVYALTDKGRRRLASERQRWLDLVKALKPMLGGQP